jgi:Heparinase II/III-like protein.
MRALNRFGRWVIAGVVVCGAVRMRAADANDPLANLHAAHPRLLARSEDWSKLRARVQSDALFAQVHAMMLRDAQEVLSAPRLERRMVGRRILDVSRSLVRRLVTLGYAWRMTDDRAFARRAEEEMLAVAAFSDWNPGHFLDVAEAAAAMAIGYDWCFDALSAESRATIRRALVEKAIRPGLDPSHVWHRGSTNWNQVCFGGLTLAALAIGDEEREDAVELLRLARPGIRNGLQPYAPDGAYPEGPSYWIYGTTYQALMIAALETALGTDWGLWTSEGFAESAGAFLQTTGPTGAFYNHGDGDERGRHEAVVYWFARKMADPGLALFNRRYLIGEALAQNSEERSWLFPFTAVWWPDETLRESAPKIPLRWHGRGPTPIVAFRESWTDRNSLYLALKGGAAELNHAHMDAGSFVLERDGVRWVIDLGAQSYYSLEAKGIDLWNRAQDSQRWQVYRLNNHSHSTLTIDGQLHRVDGHAVFAKIELDGDAPEVVVDLSAVFGGQAERVLRTFRWLPGRRVAIEDRLSGLAPGTRVRWQVPTRAEIATEGREAVLRQDGRLLRVRLTGPEGVRFAVEPAAPPPDDFNAANPGVSLLAADFTAPAGGELRFEVTFGDE